MTMAGQPLLSIADVQWVLQSVPPERRPTLVARRDVQPGGVTYHFDIHMQGAQETVFFDL